MLEELKENMARANLKIKAYEDEMAAAMHEISKGAPPADADAGFGAQAGAEAVNKLKQKMK